MKKHSIITTKSRLEVIDTTWQKEQERRVLRWLLLLLFFTILYEFGDPLLQQFATEGIVIPVVPPEVEKTIFPARRIDRLFQVIDRACRQHAFLRDPLMVFQTELAAARHPLAANPRDLKAQALVKETLGGLWKFTHISYGPEPAVFSELNAEVERAMKLLRGTLSEKASLPSLDFQIKATGSIGSVTRDLFRYNLDQSSATAEFGK